MSLGDSALTTDDVSQFAETGYDKISSIAIVALILGVMGALAPEGPITLVLVTSSVTLGFLGIVVFGLARRRSRTRRIALNVTSEFTEKDAIPSFVVSIDGEVTSSNRGGPSFSTNLQPC